MTNTEILKQVHGKEFECIFNQQSSKLRCILFRYAWIRSVQITFNDHTQIISGSIQVGVLFLNAECCICNV